MATINNQDPRVSQVQNWILGLVGCGIIAVIGWLPVQNCGGS